MRRPPFVNIATIVFVGAFIIASTLIVVLIRNPATHANLEDPQYYDRTPLAYLGADYTYLGFGVGAVVDADADPHTVGRLLYVRAGCIGCHGVLAQGAVVGGSLWDVDAEDFPRDVRDGPSGMPAYPEEILAGTELDLIYTFLQGAPQDAAAIGITTTTTRPQVTTTTAIATTTTVGTGGGDATTTTTAPQATDRSVVAPTATIEVDGDPSDWAAIVGLELIMEPIVGEGAPAIPATIKVAHDDTHVYVLFTVDDDFDWSEIDPHFSGAPAVMWAIESAAGPHMGGDDETGYPALGMVDLWYWRLDCPIGVEQGGAVHGPGDGDPGNDDVCNLDDEWASEPEHVEDDVGDGAENSLLGVFTHSNPTKDAAGTWYFEFSRPLVTGDPLDAQFAIGETARLALAYWDPDAGQNGWGRRDHVQSSNQGWINVTFAE